MCVCCTWFARTPDVCECVVHARLSSRPPPAPGPRAERVHCSNNANPAGGRCENRDKRNPEPRPLGWRIEIERQAPLHTRTQTHQTAHITNTRTHHTLRYTRAKRWLMSWPQRRAFWSRSAPLRSSPRTQIGVNLFNIMEIIMNLFKI